MKRGAIANILLQACGALFASDASSQVERDDRPDLIVSDLRDEGDLVVLEIQNQGQGRAYGTITVNVHAKAMGKTRTDRGKEIQIEAPRDFRATIERRIPLADFSITDLAEFSAMFSVTLDTANTVNESREDNNSYWRQLDRYRNGRKVLPPRANYADGGPLPDLVITDIVHDGPYLKVKYRNASTGATGADFLIRVESDGKKFDGNSYYRFSIPPGNTEQSTGGFTLGLIGLGHGAEATVTATIDWENRVRESNENNNSFTKRVRISPEGTPEYGSAANSAPIRATASTPPPSPPVRTVTTVSRASKDVTLFAPADGVTLLLPNADVGNRDIRGGSRHEYFRRTLAPNEVTVMDGCRVQVFVKEMLEHETSPDYRKEHYFISQYLGTTPSNDMCQRFNYVRRIDAQKLLQLFGLTLKDVGANPNGPNMAFVSNRPRSPNDPVQVNIGRARLEVTVVDEPKIVVNLLGVDPARK